MAKRARANRREDEAVGDDEGEFRPEFVERLLDEKAAIEAGDRGVPLEEVAADLGVDLDAAVDGEDEPREMTTAELVERIREQHNAEEVVAVWDRGVPVDLDASDIKPAALPSAAPRVVTVVSTLGGPDGPLTTRVLSIAGYGVGPYGDGEAPHLDVVLPSGVKPWWLANVNAVVLAGDVAETASEAIKAGRGFAGVLDATAGVEVVADWRR